MCLSQISKTERDCNFKKYIIIRLCLTRTGNYQIHESDLLKWISTAVHRFSHLDRHLDRWCEVKKLQTKMQNHWLFPSHNIYFCKCQKADEKKKVKRIGQTLEELNSVHRCSQAKCQLAQTSYIKRILNCSCLCRILNILLTELSRSVWENLDLGLVYRP